jgi:hypothetical protein
MIAYRKISVKAYKLPKSTLDRIAGSMIYSETMIIPPLRASEELMN